MSAIRSLTPLLAMLGLAWALGAEAGQVRPEGGNRTWPAGIHKVGTKSDCPETPQDTTTVATELALARDETLDQAWRCSDSDGEHLVTVSRLNNPGQRGTQVLFTQRTRQGNGWKKDWQARDFFLALNEGGTPPRNKVLLRDADGDGHIEAYIAYVLPGPSQAVDEGKLLVFSSGRKFAIRGAIPRSPDDFGSRQIGTAFHELPPPVQAQALALWDQLSKPAPIQPARAGRL